MKISLRKANAIQASIVDAIAGLDLSTEVSINEFERPTDKIDTARERFLKNLERRDALQEALYEIRQSVSTANAASGISSLLADLASIDKDISLYAKLAKLRPALPMEVILGKIGKIKSRADGEHSVYGYGETEVQTSLFGEVAINNFKAKLNMLKVGKNKLQDQLLERNVYTEIEISADAKETLSDTGLI
jgi:hypothetical protein